MSGAGPFDSHGNLVGEGDVVRQCEATCANIDRMLSAADMSPRDIVYFKVLMEEVYDGPKINPVRIDFHGDAYPGSTRVRGGHLALPGMLLEIECVATAPERRAAERGNPLRGPVRAAQPLYRRGEMRRLRLHLGDRAHRRGRQVGVLRRPGETGLQDAREHGSHARRRGHGFRGRLQGRLLPGECPGSPEDQRRAQAFLGAHRPASTLFGIRGSRFRG